MTVEERLRDALRSTDEYQPSPDLFAKVRRSIDEDRAHRRRVGRIAAGAFGFAATIVLWLAVWWDPQPGRAPLPWWSVVAVVVAVQVAIVSVVGPAIRRFGRTYADDVFRTNPSTGPRFLALLDVAYYLVFVGYILIVIPFRPEAVWRSAGGFPELLQSSAAVVAGLLLLMGALHALTIFALPFVGLVFASSRHRLLVHEKKEQWSPEVRRAHRTVTIVLIVVSIFFVWEVLGFLLGLIAIGLSAAGM